MSSLTSKVKEIAVCRIGFLYSITIIIKYTLYSVAKKVANNKEYTYKHTNEVIKSIYSYLLSCHQ